jgi:hypothetical protein
MDEENKPTKTLIDEAKEVAERIEKANERQAELLRQQEDLQARRMLGGRADAGQMQKQKSDEEIKKEGAAEFFKGSQIEKAIKKYG